MKPETSARVRTLILRSRQRFAAIEALGDKVSVSAVREATRLAQADMDEAAALMEKAEKGED